METVDLNALPNLPGFGFKRKPTQCGKKITLQLVNGVRMDFQGQVVEKPKMVLVEAIPDVRRRGLMGETATQDHFTAPELKQTQLPAYDVLDRHVLRFYGHFSESAVETWKESSNRSRLLTIMFYLEDDTFEVTEKKQDNSGMPQGRLIRRHRLPFGDRFLQWQDLMINSSVEVYGRIIHISDCDPFTRRYYESHGIEMATSHPLPEDDFAKTQQSLKAEKKLGPPKSFESNYRETMLGGGHINGDMQQFMDWDRKVCRFYAVHDDVSSSQFERRPFEILYFLADNTVEIREKYPANCGRHGFAIFYRRGKLPRGKVRVRSPLENAPSKKEMVAVEDFNVGEAIELLGMLFHIYDADAFTRQFFKEVMGTELAKQQDVRLPDRTVPRAKTPPYTGYGSWEDSLGSVYKLMPKPPRRDHVKLFQNDRKVLRFTAKIHNPMPQDADRSFVVCWYLQDDCLMIHEPPVRNLGIITGKFLEKGVHKNQITNELFSVKDLYPGSVIKVVSREFQIMEPDEYTRKYLSENGIHRAYDLEAVLAKLREGMRQQFPNVRDTFRRFDSDKDGVLTFDEFKQAMARWHFYVQDEEVVIMMKHFDSRKDGQISYNEFCDALLDPDYTTSMVSTKPPLDKEFDEGYAEQCLIRVQEREETAKIRAAVRAAGDVVYKQTQIFPRLCKELRHVSHGASAFVSAAQIADVLSQMGCNLSVEDLQRVVCYVLPQADLDNVPYMDFLKALGTSYHDVSAVR